MDEFIMQNIQHLSKDVKEHILSYTYSPQPSDLLSDIRDYTYSLDYIKKVYFSRWLLDDIFEYVNEIFILNYYDFWRRLFVFRNITEEAINNHLLKSFYQKYMQTQINILWGLLTPLERSNIIYLYFQIEDEDENNHHEENELEQEDYYDY